jgi:type IV secretion system protein VirB2
MSNRYLEVAEVKRTCKTVLMACLFVGSIMAPNAFANFGDADKKVCGFFDNITGLLGMASIAVVTIAVIFAGYQIAFAHKRIADVAPILIGGLLIGAASQIAKMLLGDSSKGCQGSTAMILEQTRYIFGA